MIDMDLSEALDERRLELGMRWEDVARAGGISYETIRNVRNGRPMRPLTKANLERALRLKRGSIDAGVLTPLDEPDEPELPPFNEVQQAALDKYYNDYLPNHGPDEAMRLLQRDIDAINAAIERKQRPAG